MRIPFVSVVVPIYNADKYLKETIESVLSQTYQNFELLLIDHNSNDNSLSIIKKYEESDTRVRVIHLDINKGGPAYPRNIGTKASRGVYIAYLDSDDIWLPVKLEKQVEAIETKSVDIVHTLANIIDAQSKQVGEFKNQKLFNLLRYFFKKENIIFYTNYININSVMIKNSADINFSEEKSMIAMEDWKLWIDSISKDKSMYLIKEKLMNYRVHNASVSNRDSDIGYRRSLLLLASLLFEKKIPLRHYIFSSTLQVCKILVKNMRLK